MEPLNPPVPGTTISQDIRDISIDKPIRDGDSCGAQVLLTSEGLIAKFFDPLCYDFENKDRYEKANVTASADRDYVAETAAYLAPHTTSFQGGVMPKCFGSWTVDVPITMNGETKYREVRMILIEHVVGTRPQDMRPANLAREERENIMICSGLWGKGITCVVLLLLPPLYKHFPHTDTSGIRHENRPWLRLYKRWPQQHTEPKRYTLYF
jgi:hypothetical protein